MTAHGRPWWASDGPVGDGADPTEDPLERHRQARRGEPAAEDAAAGGDAADVCGVCPICTGLRVLGETRPDLLNHLTEASRHVAAAVRDLLDHPPTRDDRDDPSDDALHRIDLD